MVDISLEQSLYLRVGGPKLLQVSCHFVSLPRSLVRVGRQQGEDQVPQAFRQAVPVQSRWSARLARDQDFFAVPRKSPAPATIS